MRKVQINMRALFYELLFLLVVTLGAITWGKQKGFALAVIIMGALFLVGGLFLLPWGYVLDEKGIRVLYGFGFRAVAAWDEIEYVEENRAPLGIASGFREYRVGYFHTKNPFFREVSVPKNRAIQTIMEQYCKKEVFFPA